MRTGLIPMAAKPYHAGHHAMVEKAARENDKVLLFVSLSDRKRPGEFPILGETMRKIWEDHIKRVLPGNVVVVYSKIPVKDVIDTLISAEELKSKDVFTVYSDPVDTTENFPEIKRLKYFPTMYAAGRVRFAAEADAVSLTRGGGTPNVSGTKVRQILAAGDFKGFENAMPLNIDALAVYSILRGDTMLEAALLKNYIKLILS